MEEELLKFRNKLNQKHKIIKFDFKYSKTKKEFLDFLVFKRSIVNCKQHSIKKQARSLKESIVARKKALRVKRIFYTNFEFEAHINTIKDQLVKGGYEKTLIENQIEKVATLDRSVLLAEQNKGKKTSYLPLSVTYNRTLSNIKIILQQQWHLLKINSTLEDTFQQTPILAFRKSRNLRDSIGSKETEFNKVKRKSLTVGNCTPCLSNNRTLCCKQMIKTTTFQSNKQRDLPYRGKKNRA